MNYILTITVLLSFIVLASVFAKRHFASVAIAVVLVQLVAFPLNGGQALVGSLAVFSVIVLCAFFLPAYRTSFSAAHLPLLMYLLFGLVLVWPNETQLLSAAIYLLAPLAWLSGRALGSSLNGNIPAERIIVYSSLSVVVLQAIVCGLQTQGIELFPTNDVTATLTAGRAHGTFGHPGDLGKAIVCLMGLVLPMTISTAMITRRVAVVTLGVAFIPILLSQSRTNLIAAAILIVCWVALIPRGKGRNLKFTLPALLAVVGFYFSDAVIARFEVDPIGGERERFLAVALEHIPDNFLAGVGPGNYISYFGKFDTLTAQGWPVHNSFLLILAELGIIGFLLLFVPVLIALLGTALRLIQGKRRITLGRANLAFTIAILVIGMTGWGLASASILPLWFFVSAILSTSLFKESNRKKIELTIVRD